MLEADLAPTSRRGARGGRDRSAPVIGESAMFIALVRARPAPGMRFDPALLSRCIGSKVGPPIVNSRGVSF